MGFMVFKSTGLDSRFQRKNRLSAISQQLLTRFWPNFKGRKKIVQIMGFMVFKSTGLDSRFQRKKRFWKICTESRDIGQNVSNFAGLVWKADFGHFFGNILGPYENFSKLIFELKPWVWEPYNRNNFFSSLVWQAWWHLKPLSHFHKSYNLFYICKFLRKKKSHTAQNTFYMK